ncbi:hypothetical protein [Moraxella lacunata]
MSLSNHEKVFYHPSTSSGRTENLVQHTFWTTAKCRYVGANCNSPK